MHNTAPGTFGIQEYKLSEIPKENNEGMEIGEPGFDAPENVAFVVLGLLYGEGDFVDHLTIVLHCSKQFDVFRSHFYHPVSMRFV